MRCGNYGIKGDPYMIIDEDNEICQDCKIKGEIYDY